MATTAACSKAELDTSSDVVSPALQVLGRQVGEFCADLPQSSGGRGVVRGLVGLPGLAVGEVPAGDTLHLGGAGQIDGSVRAPFEASRERSQGRDYGGDRMGGVLRAEGGAGVTPGCSTVAVTPVPSNLLASL
jgi:hypothetical protein